MTDIGDDWPEDEFDLTDEQVRRMWDEAWPVNSSAQTYPPITTDTNSFVRVTWLEVHLP